MIKVFGLTGGIATGKSAAACIFRAYQSVALFDADECVRELYQREKFLAQLECFDHRAFRDGEIRRNYLRRRLFNDKDYKKELEDLVHPFVRKECLAFLELSKQNKNTSLFIADIPLLFENGFDFGQDANLVVATTRETQRQRLIDRNNFSDAVVTAILEAQLPIAQKIERGDVVFWNEGNKRILERQIKRFIECTI